MPTGMINTNQSYKKRFCYILVLTQWCDSSGRLQEYRQATQSMACFQSGAWHHAQPDDQAASVLFSSMSSSILGAKKNLMDPMSAMW